MNGRTIASACLLRDGHQPQVFQRAFDVRARRKADLIAERVTTAATPEPGHGGRDGDRRRRGQHADLIAVERAIPAAIGNEQALHPFRQFALADERRRCCDRTSSAAR